MSNGASGFFSILIFVAGATPVFAQSGYQTDFANGNGWTFSGGAGTTGWAVDATPSTPAANSPTNSLNYNNGTTYNEGGAANGGKATSPTVNLSGLATPTLTFWCNFQTEPGSEDAAFGYDTRTISIIPGTGTDINENLGVTGAGPTVGACSAAGAWHQHTIALDPAWGTVYVVFQFETIDGLFNDYYGWFIDDFQISGSGGGNQPPATYQTVIEWNYDAGLGGWVVQSTAAPAWNADGAPATVVAATPYVSSPNSLNYNNDTDYLEGTANSGTATSPSIDLAALDSPRLVFQCNFQTEPGSESATFGYDQRWLEISNDDFATTVYTAGLGTTGQGAGVGACSAMGTWHTHTVNLDKTWGTVKIRFRFDSVDGLYNTYAGWFVDDSKIEALGAPPGGGGGGSGGKEGENGDNGINDSCGGSVARVGAGWTLVAILGLALLLGVRRAA